MYSGSPDLIQAVVPLTFASSGAEIFHLLALARSL